MADSVRVVRADTLRARVAVDLLDGAVRWALTAPDGRTAWAGSARDTVAEWAAPDPDDGVWRIVLRPDSAIGVADLALDAR